MNPNPEILIITSSLTPYAVRLQSIPKIKAPPYHLVSADHLPANSNAKWIFDLTVTNTDEKDLLLQEMFKRYSKSIIFSEAAVNNVELLLQKYPQLGGLMASSFTSPTSRFEFYAPPKHHWPMEERQKVVDQFFSELQMQSKAITFVKTGFHYPRIISTLINEANYASKEQLCSEHDLELAMQKGLNYPLGLLEWQKRIGPPLIALMLEELYAQTKNMRYAKA